MESNIHIKTDGSLLPTTRSEAINDVAPTGRETFNEAGAAAAKIKPIDARNVMPTDIGYGSYFGESNVVYPADGEVNIQDAFAYLLPSGETAMIRLTATRAEIDSIASPAFQPLAVGQLAPIPLPTPSPLLQLGSVTAGNATEQESIGVHTVQLRRSGGSYFLDSLLDGTSLVAAQPIGTQFLAPEAKTYHVVAEAVDSNGVKGLRYFEIELDGTLPAGSVVRELNEAASVAAVGLPVVGTVYSSMVSSAQVVASALDTWASLWAKLATPNSKSVSQLLEAQPAPVVLEELSLDVLSLPAITVQGGLQDPIDPFIPITQLPDTPFQTDIPMPPEANAASVLLPVGSGIHLWVTNDSTGVTRYIPEGAATVVVGRDLSYVSNTEQGTPNVNFEVTPLVLEAPNDGAVSMSFDTTELSRAFAGTSLRRVGINPCTITKLYISSDWNVITIFDIPAPTTPGVLQSRVNLYPANPMTGEPTLYVTVLNNDSLPEVEAIGVPTINGKGAWFTTAGLSPQPSVTYSQLINLELTQEVGGNPTNLQVQYWQGFEPRGNAIVGNNTYELLIDGKAVVTSNRNFPSNLTQVMRMSIPTPAAGNYAPSVVFNRWSKAVVNNTLYLFQEGQPIAWALRSDGSGFTPVSFGETNADYATRTASVAGEVTRLAIANGVAESVILANPTAYNLYVDVPQQTREMSVIQGIFESSGRLGAWDTTGSLLWSGSIPPSQAEIDGYLLQPTDAPIIYDFINPAYGAATSKPPGIKGRTVNVLSTEGGFLVYSSGSIVFGYPVTNGAVFAFKVHSPSVGIYDFDQVVQGDRGIHYALTSAGLAAVTEQGMEVIEPQVSNHLTKSTSPVRLRYLNNRYLVLEGEWEQERGAIAGSGFFTPNPIASRTTIIPPPIQIPLDGLSGAGVLGQDVCGLWRYHGYQTNVRYGAESGEWYMEAIPKVTEPVSKIWDYSVTSLLSHWATFAAYVAFSGEGAWSSSMETTINPCWFKGPTLATSSFTAKLDSSRGSYDPSVSLSELGFGLGAIGIQGDFSLQDYLDAYGGGTLAGSLNSDGGKVALRNALQNPQTLQQLQSSWGLHGTSQPDWLVDPALLVSGSVGMIINGARFDFNVADAMLTIGIPAGAMVTQELALDTQKFLTLHSANEAGYSVYNKAMVLDIQTSKWGRYDSPHRLVIDFAPVNVGSFDAITGNRNVQLNYSSFQGSLGGILPDGSIVAFDDKPIDSWIEYGKVGLGLKTHTNFHRAQAIGTRSMIGSVKVYGSQDGDRLDADRSVDVQVASRQATRLESVGLATGKWGSVFVNGWFDIKDLYVKGTRAGVR